MTVITEERLAERLSELELQPYREEHKVLTELRTLRARNLVLEEKLRDAEAALELAKYSTRHGNMFRGRL